MVQEKEGILTRGKTWRRQKQHSPLWGAYVGELPFRKSNISSTTTGDKTAESKQTQVYFTWDGESFPLIISVFLVIK